VNQAAQCVDAILIAPLIKKWPTRTVLTAAILLFGLMTVILLIVDAATGGKIQPKGAKSPVYGTWNPNLVSETPLYLSPVLMHRTSAHQIFVVWTLAGISYGMVELIRRVMYVPLSSCSMIARF
jgi:hypothetical protein